MKMVFEYRLMGGEPPGMNNLLRIYENGFCTCLIATESFLDMKKRETEAGYYEGKLDSDAVDSFLALLKKHAGGFEQENFPCDSVIAKLGFVGGLGNKEIFLLREKMPENLWKAIKDIILKLRKTPVWTVRLGLSVVKRGDSRGLRTNILSSGRERIEISNPRLKSGGTPHTNLILDGFPKKDPRKISSYDDLDETIRCMDVSPSSKSERPFLLLNTRDEITVFHTPKNLIEYSKKRPARVVAQFRGVVKSGKNQQVQIEISSNAVDFYMPKGLKNR